LLCIRALKVI